MGPALFRSAPHRRWQQRGQGAQVKVGFAVAIAFVQFHHPVHEGFHAGNFRNGVPVPLPGLNPFRPGGPKIVEHRRIPFIGRQEVTGETVKISFGQAAPVAAVAADRLECVVHGLVGHFSGPLLVVDINAGIGGIEGGPGPQKACVLRVGMDQAVHHQQVGRSAGLNGFQIVGVEDGIGQVVGKTGGGRGKHRRTARQADR